MIAADFAAMGTTISVTAADDEGIAGTRRWFGDVEQACSRFLPASALSRMNDDPRHEVPVPPELTEVMAVADEVRGLTAGLVDAGVGADLLRWGYDRTFAHVRDVGEQPAEAGRFEPWVLRDGHLIRRPGIRIDLGGIAKGWAADCAVRSGMAQIVSAGGDIASSHPGCEVDVLGLEAEVIAEVALGVGALATSSVARRRWRVAGAAAHHIIDPRTGAPAVSPVLSATVIARRAVAAEAGAKAVLLRGVDGLAWAARQNWIDAALAVWADGSVYATSGLELAA